MESKEPPTERQIALAATRFIRSKLVVKELKDARAKALTEKTCSMIANEYPPCYLSGTERSDWCDNCRANQPHHEAYRTAAAQKANALRNLQSVVVRSLAEEGT
jgi:hypothetical protein